MMTSPQKLSVLMQNRIDLYEKGGGDLVQMLKIKEGLEKLGVKVSISTELEPDLQNYDIVHLYNVSRIHETYMQYLNAKKHGKKVVISPIYHSMKEINLFRRQGQTDFFRLISFFLRNYYAEESFKNIIRYITDSRQRKAIMLQLQQGFAKEQKEVLRNVDAWILLADKEGETIQKELGITNRSFIVPNGVDFQNTPDPKSLAKIKSELPFSEFVLSVGRIEPRKNQLNLIKALWGTGLNLIFIGDINPNYNNFLNNSYVHRFQKIVQEEKWIYWLKNIPHEEIENYYRLARIHANTSWFEVASLVNLEAAIAGCQVVMSDVGYQKDFFQNQVFYCQPDDSDSIQRAILEAYHHPKSSQDDFFKKKKFSWDLSSEKTYNVYSSVLKDLPL